MIKIIQHLCPCCSQPLLRHISCQRVYWFCSQCHQEMPDLKNLAQTQLQLVPQHWASQHTSSRKPLKKGFQQSEKLFFMEDNKDLQRLAFSDSLTKVANRLRFQAYLEQQWRMMAHEQAPLSLIIGDFDFFKAYNDYYGRQEGDKCLQLVAQAIVSVVKRSADLVPRYGGEEFVVILPQTKAEGAYQVAQEIISKIKSLKIPHLYSQISPYLSLSLGVASIIPSDEYSADLLISAADQALHQAKAQGRDRIILHENLLQQINILLPEPTLALPSSCGENKETSTKSDQLMSYVAYYLSRGKSILSPMKGVISFEGLVYEYWGYQKKFEDFWQQLQQRRDFYDLHIDGDLYSFGQFLGGRCTVGECARCNLPIPQSIGGVLDTSNCTLCVEPWLSNLPVYDPESPNLEEEYHHSRMIAIGTPPADYKTLEELFFVNGIDMTFVSTPEDLLRQSLPGTVDLVMILAEVSEAEGKAWAQELKGYEQFSDVPIVALSSNAGHGLPWMERSLEIADYVLTPHNGDRLAYYLRQVLQPQSNVSTTELHWFPR